MIAGSAIHDSHWPRDCAHSGQMFIVVHISVRQNTDTDSTVQYSNPVPCRVPRTTECQMLVRVFTTDQGCSSMVTLLMIITLNSSCACLQTNST
jgi:hypothetical protein